MTTVNGVWSQSGQTYWYRGWYMILFGGPEFSVLYEDHRTQNVNVFKVLRAVTRADAQKEVEELAVEVYGI